MVLMAACVPSLLYAAEPLGVAPAVLVSAALPLVSVLTRGRTPGRAICGVRLLGPRGRAPARARVLVRELVLPVAAAALRYTSRKPAPAWVFRWALGVADLLFVLASRDQRGLSDRIAGTRVAA